VPPLRSGSEQRRKRYFVQRKIYYNSTDISEMERQEWVGVLGFYCSEPVFGSLKAANPD
jgi:hypothetical protein